MVNNVNKTDPFPPEIGQRISLGATCLDDRRCGFRVWAPKSERVDVRILGPQPQRVPMRKRERGYFDATLEGVEAGSRYVYVLDHGNERPDPASRFQPEGVHKPSQVVDSRGFGWTDADWRGIALDEYVLYELHVGTYTREGTFDAIIPHLENLKNLGITALELMPVAQFPGDRNWGYDGAYPFAVENSYGGPEGLMRLVNACHARGLAVTLDVVYNHLGPEGNYLGEFGYYFTDKYKTPWGQAVNFDGPHSDEVVRYFIENALSWISDFHIDALRLDAIHGIVDRSAQPFLRLLAQAVHKFSRRSGRQIYLIAESDFNDVRYIQPRDCGGYGIDAQWSDDLHHAVHALLTSETNGYYQDFGKVEDLVKALREGFVYSGQYSAYREQRHGNSSLEIPARQFVVFDQNHDQTGNRMLGERLSKLVSFEALKLAAGVVILSPFIPLLFMGEEYGEEAAFNYFTSHGDSDLIEAVRAGRRSDFAAFRWKGEPPDPQSEESFLASKLRHDLAGSGSHRNLREFYRALLRLRKERRALAHLSKQSMEVTGFEVEKALAVRRWLETDEVFIVCHFGKETTRLELPLPAGTWTKLLDSTDPQWAGKGSRIPQSLQSQGSPSLELPSEFLIVFGRDL